jgi:hypothetical protein
MELNKDFVSGTTTAVCISCPSDITHVILSFPRKELNLLQKLYGLYDTVMGSISGYYEILWGDVDIEKINAELQEFQNR